MKNCQGGGILIAIFRATVIPVVVPAIIINGIAALGVYCGYKGY